MNQRDASDSSIRFETWAPRGAEAEPHWQALEALSQHEREEAVCTRISSLKIDPPWAQIEGVHWRVILPQLDMPEDAKARFWVEFSKASAVQNRKEALRGLRIARRERALEILESARHAYANFQSLDPSSPKRYLEALGKCGAAFEDIGKWFSERVYYRDHEILVMATQLLIKGDDGDPQSCAEANTNDGVILRIFCHKHIEDRTLPTKKGIFEDYGRHRGAILAELDLTDRQALSKQVSKSLNKLGLANLPP